MRATKILNPIFKKQKKGSKKIANFDFLKRINHFANSISQILSFYQGHYNKTPLNTYAHFSKKHPVAASMLFGVQP